MVCSSFCGWVNWCIIQFIHCRVALVVQTFTELLSGRAKYCYLAFGEFSRSVDFLLQKMKVSSSLPLVEKWQEYILANYLFFASIAKEHILERTRLLAALEKVNSVYFLRTAFRKNCHHFFKEFESTILSTVATRSLIGQGLSCFCPEIIFEWGGNCSAFYLLRQLMDWLLGHGWV